MVDYTNPITTTFEMQRTSIEQSRKAFQRTADFHQTVSEAFVDGLESQETAQQRAVELHQEAVHSSLDAVEANVPGSETAVADVREAVDEQYDVLLENHAEAFEALADEFEEGVAAYDGMTALDFVGAFDPDHVGRAVECDAEHVEPATEVRAGRRGPNRNHASR